MWFVNTRPNEEDERRKRRRELAVALGAVVIIAALFLVESRLAGYAPGIELSSHLLLFALLSIATLLLILVFFFLIRNLFKLVFERRQRVLGSNLKTRLTVALVALTLVPTIVLFIASVSVLHTTIESWFKSQVEESLQSALVIAQDYYKFASESLLNSGSRTADYISGLSLLNPTAKDELHRVLEARRTEDGLSSIQVHFRDGSPPLVVKDPSLGPAEVPEPRRSFLKIAFQGEKNPQIRPLESGADVVRGIVPIWNDERNTVDAVLVADYYLPMSLSRRLFEISNAFGDYEEAKRMRGPVKTIYVLILLMVALLVIFIGFWFGLRIATDITEPIERLATGTESIAAGDLDVHIKPVADDELGVLVRSFNKMAEDLRKGRDELIRVNLDLDSRRKYMETILGNVAAGVLAVDPDLAITAVNGSARELLGISRAEIDEWALMAVLPEVSAEAIAEVLEELRDSGGQALERQITLSFPDRSLSLICFANSLTDEEGRDLGVVLVLEDMTQLVRAQRMAAWRDVARRIAHEIKNPLTPIQLNAQRLRRRYLPRLAEDREVLNQCTNAIIDQVEQLKNLVNEFSKFARMPAANPVPNDLNMIVQEVIGLYAQANEQITFSFHPDSAVPVFPIDKEQMKRALINLLDNATAAVGEHGRIKISTRFFPDLSMVFLEVADNGSGIRPADRHKLFEPYFSRKPGGTGLGLTIVSTIVSDHNGFVRVKDNAGGGTTFVIELPVRQKTDIPMRG